ncbi:MAG: hypothetical protein R3277_12350 [Brumimicrobium sp.]|nr:hypothetical protein [Brumimicrobium sp.]
MTKTTKKLIALASLSIFLVSCGGHGVCDAYSYYDYKKEAKEIKENTPQKNHTENGTI